MHWHYRGDPNMWAWLLHRLTGIGIFIFLLIHIVDTALIGWGKQIYDAVIQLYHHPAFRIGEILLFGVVLFHAINGLRVIVLDFAPKTIVYQRQMLVCVIVVFLITFVPSAIIMVGQISGHQSLSLDWNGWKDLRAWLPAFAAFFAVCTIMLPSLTTQNTIRSTLPVTSLEFYGWIFIRVSGLLLIFLVLGHLFIMHLMDGGVNRVNFEFVAQRFSTPFWRTYDFVMLTLAMGHGVWGMRTVLLDYIHRPFRRFLALTLLYVVSGITLALGALVLFTFKR